MEDYITPVYLGPTWQRDEAGEFLLPEKTLGWGALGWIMTYCKGPEGEPFMPTNEQARFILWWYGVNGGGRFVYQRGVLQRLKGWGKDPLLAALCLFELCGPCRFSHWGDGGQPVGKACAEAWVQVAATTRDQTRNTMNLFPAMIGPEMKAEYDIDAGAELIRAMGGRRRIEAVTSNPRALEGGRTTFTVMNETHHWVPSRRGDEMYETIDNNAAKKMGRYLAITNAFLPGEDSVAEKMRLEYEMIQDGRSRAQPFLYDSVEGNPGLPLTEEALREALPLIRGDSVWLDIDRIIESLMSTSISVTRSRRMWLNQIQGSDEALVSAADYDACVDPDTSPLRDGERVVLGFDGGLREDSTALVAIRLSDLSVHVLLVEEKPVGDDDWEVDRGKVDRAVRGAHERYEVEAFFADVKLWESFIFDWTRDFGSGYTVRASGDGPIAWDMRGATKRVTFAHEAALQAVLDRKVKFPLVRPRDRLSGVFRRHVLNAHRKENKWGVSFGKENRDSVRRVDAYAAFVIAYAAAEAVLTKGASSHNGGWYFF